MIKREFNRKKILLVDDLSPEDIAMVQALYARRSESAETHIQKIYDGRREAVRDALNAQAFTTDEQNELVDPLFEIMRGEHASARAGKFMASYLVGYGHKSIGDCGTFTVFIEGVSILVAKAFQDWPLYSGQETSTRAIDFSRSDDEKKIVGRLVDPTGSDRARLILHRWMSFYARSRLRVADEVRRRHPRRPEEDAEKYERAVDGRVFDILRGFLPAGVTTQFSWHTNIRQAGDHLIGLIHHPLAEVREVALVLAQMLQGRYPSSAGCFGGLPALSGIGKQEKDEERASRSAWERLVAKETSYLSPEGAPGLSTTLTKPDLEPWTHLIETRPRGGVLPHFLTDLGQLRFRFGLDFGSFRDIQRHRNGVCRMPLLDTSKGFETWYLDQLDAESRQEADALVAAQTDAILLLDAEPAERQYYLAMGFKVPVSVTYGLPAAVYVMELRAGKTIHPTLRRAIHSKMIAPFRRAFPKIPLHVDMDPDDWSIRRGSQTITAR